MTLTPKEKAKELLERFLTPNLVSPLYGVLNYEQAKQCALIAVNEILCSGALSPQLKRHVLTGLQPDITELEYWYQVKEEIEKL